MEDNNELTMLSVIRSGWRFRRYALSVLFLLILVFQGMSQTPTVASLTATGTDIKWYLTSTGGTALDPSTPLVNGQYYYASQTVNGCESSTRLEVVANLVTQASPGEGIHVPSQTQIVWNWTAVAGATGYRIHFINHYNSAVFMYSNLTVTEPGLTCNTAYTRYVWAVNAMGCISQPTVITQTTSTCVNVPSVTTDAAGGVGATTATLNGNITSTGGANCTVRGFKYSTTSGFDPAVSGTNVPETGSFPTGTFSAALTGLSAGTAFYYVAYATNTAGTTYGSQVGFNTVVQTDFAYTGSVQNYTVPGNGYYTLEVWGAQGGDDIVDFPPVRFGGRGGYSKGVVQLTAGTILYIYVGGQGSGCTSGWRSTGGGGATDIRLTGGAWDNSAGFYSRIIVAGGGGGRHGNNYESPSAAYIGNEGGGTSAPGYSVNAYTITGADQTSGGTSTYSSSVIPGSFGYASPNTNTNSCSVGGYNGGARGSDGWANGGPGGGWYGGVCSWPTSSGGSGYVLTSGSYKPSGYTPGASYYMTNTVVTAGGNSMPNPAGGTMNGRTGNGYARISPYNP